MHKQNAQPLSVRTAKAGDHLVSRPYQPGAAAPPSRRLRRTAVLVVTCLAALAAPAAATSAPLAANLSHIRPGEPAALRDDMPINYVFVGYDPDDIDEAEFRSGLPRTYEPIERLAHVALDEMRPVGITHVFEHRVLFADDAYEDRFFAHLASIAVQAPLTTYQRAYNAQERRRLDIDHNTRIHGPAVERWLADNPPPGVSQADHTVFFVNWYGRDGFRFHVYDKAGEPDSDFPAADRGALDGRVGIAWGGSSSDDPETGLGSTQRIWFYDLSAGPEYATRNYDVTNRDLDGDGAEDYRMPPVWEYAADGYREREALTGDLAKVARFVAIDMLFTPSPLYTPSIKHPTLGTRVNLDLNFYDTAAQDGSAVWVDEHEIARAVDHLLPDREVTVDKQDVDFHAPDHARCFTGLVLAPAVRPGCYTAQHPSYVASANLFVHNVKTLDHVFDDADAADYEAGAFSYWLPVNPFGVIGCVGWADSNHHDATQSFVYMVLSPHCTHGRSGSGYFGYTDFLIHEYGHHFGMSHSHDGYDSELDRHFTAYEDAYLFTWVGDEVNSVMSYNFYNNEFSQFDLDNLTRWLTAGYLAAINELATYDLDGEALRKADRVVGSATTAFSARRYSDGLRYAMTAHAGLLAEAERAGVTIADGWTGQRLVDASPPSTQVKHLLDHPGAYMFVDDLHEIADRGQ